MARVSLFISCVSNEFGPYRDALRKDLSRPNLTAAIQEDFIAYGASTLQKLDEYIRDCDAVIHLCGDMTGSTANALSLEYINKTYPDFGTRFPLLKPVLEGREGLSYTQWEAWLAGYHGKYLFVATPTPGAVRSDKHRALPEPREQQQKHLKALASCGYYNEIVFATQESLALQLYRSKLGDLLAKLHPNKPISLPYHSIGQLFKGRESDLLRLYKSLKADPGRPAAIVGNAIHGLGGIGKTRLAVEYAWSYRNEYNALFCVVADSPENLFTNLAALAAPTILNLPEYAATELQRYEAVINWLNQNTGWLLVFDNVDTAQSAQKAENLYARLAGGHVLITGRQSNWSAQVAELPLDVLKPAAAVAFLLERTAEKRRRLPQDDMLAEGIANDLGYLALALEQAGAYITARRLTLEQYRQAWQNQHGKVLEWFDERLMQYPKSVATTWQTSVEQLSTAAKTLLNRLAWLASDPVPERLLEIEIEEGEGDGFAALTNLADYSLVKRADERAEFTVHRLVQDVSRMTQNKEDAEKNIAGCLKWLNEGFAGNPQDIRDWPVLEPLVPHITELFTHKYEKRLDNAPMSRLLNQLGLLYLDKAQHKLAEPLMRKALEIDEQSFGKDHPNVAIRLNNLASLLQSTNRLAEAEPLMRRALEIDEQSFGKDHPKVAIRLNNLASLLQATNRLAEAEPLMRSGFIIFFVSLGSDHPNTRTVGNNYIILLQDMGKTEEEIKATLSDLLN